LIEYKGNKYKEIFAKLSNNDNSEIQEKSKFISNKIYTENIKYLQEIKIESLHHLQNVHQESTDQIIDKKLKNDQDISDE
jgi:hypothetical protein